MDKPEEHRDEVRAFLRRNVAEGDWTLAPTPRGTGHETFVARTGGRACFIKLGAETERTAVVAALGLTPPVISAGRLDDGTPIVVQPFVEARRPGPRDFQAHPAAVAGVVRALHHGEAVRRVLPPAASQEYREAGLLELSVLRGRWDTWKDRTPGAAGFVDESLERLGSEIERSAGSGLVASHNDINNGNWLVTPGGRWYLLDLESMSLEDPARDLGALLWWYYPPEMRAGFLAAAGYDAHDADMEARMRVRMAMHCLHIALPRPGSFDVLDPAWFARCLEDFRAVIERRQNPLGYGE
jgi:aminoglycoside phosphotransferase (APT) family kinase protein